MKSNKSSTVYATNSYVVGLAASPSGKSFVSGHADCSIVHFTFEDAGTEETRGLLCHHSSAPYAIAYTSHGVLVGGCDRRIVVYDPSGGHVVQQFDFGHNATLTPDGGTSAIVSDSEFTCAACSPSGFSVIFGSFDRLQILNWSPRKSAWEDPISKVIPNLYTITALSWKPDGSKVLLGTLCGSVEMFNSTLKKINYKKKFEIVHVGLNQVIVTCLSTGQKAVLKSQYGYEIDNVRIMGSDRYAVANSTQTIILADLLTNRFTEIPWQSSGEKEKFYFDNENVCMIFNLGELTLVEYGNNDVIGCVRTEYINPHLISVRLNERQSKRCQPDSNKKLAYLLDMKTIAIVDLVTENILAEVEHDSKVDWLELNETGRYLLFRDKKLKLNLYFIEAGHRVSILNSCLYVQWVPGSDVVVAQNRGNLCVWYNIEAYEKVTMIPLKGDIISLERKGGKTEVVVSSGVSSVVYTLDEGLIEFATAIDDGDLIRAVEFLETLELSSETEVMWKTLSTLALQEHQLYMACRCFAAVRDVCKSQFLEDIIKIAEENSEIPGELNIDHYQVKARLAIIEKSLKEAENIYLEQNQVDEAIHMYQDMHMWQEAIEVAEAKCHPNVEVLKQHHYNWLIDTGQHEAAGQVKEREGEYMTAITLYLKSGLPTKAARVVTGQEELLSNTEVTSRVATALVKAELYEQAGNMYERTGDVTKALHSYRKGQSFQQAVELARRSFPSDVVSLEEQWGDYLVSQKHMDAAINHFIEAGCTTKAIDSAISSNQWKKAVQILELQDASTVANYYKVIADHYAEVKEYKVAERLYLAANCMKDAVDMYNQVGMWQQAHKLASKFMKPDAVSSLYVSQAEKLREQGKIKEAERLYLTVQEPEKAIDMYKQHKMYPDVIRLVKLYNRDMLEETYCRMAKEVESDGNLRQAEEYLLSANNAKAAINMYRSQNMWSDAYRIAKSHCPELMSKQVAFLWARNLGGDSAVKLLSRFGLLEEAIDYAAEQCVFDFAFDLAHVGMKEKLPSIHLKQAMYLEDEGKISEAELGFIKAGRPKEAVLMYMHNKDWDSALRIAESHDPELVTEVLVGQAQIAFQEEDFARAESLLLRAHQPEKAIAFYKKNEMWQDALRLCQQYLPNKLAAVQEEYEQVQMSKSSRGIETIIRQARELESKKEFSRAVDCFLKVSDTVTTDVNIMMKCWNKAVDLAVKFLGHNRSVDVVVNVATRLDSMDRHNTAAGLYLKVDMYKEAVDMYIKANDWSSAKMVVQEHDIGLESYLKERYKDSMKTQGRVDALANVDMIAALDMYVEKKQWKKCLEMAEKQGRKVLQKYVAIYAAHLINEGRSLQALELYSMYGAPASQQNFNIYKRIFSDVVAMPGLNTPESFKVWSSLRNMFYSLYTEILKNTSVTSDTSPSSPLQQQLLKEYRTYLLVAHYYTSRSAVRGSADQSLATVATKLSVALLRHTDIVPADKAFYEAGLDCKNVGWEAMAFVFTNHLLDIAEAIEDGSLDSLDHSDFQNTDIPFEIPLPERPYLSASVLEQQKEWVLEVSMNQNVEQVLPKDERGVYEASLVNCLSGYTSLPCLITGYPVLRNQMPFSQPGIGANKDDWNKLFMASKVSHSPEIQDVLQFVCQWAQVSSDLSYSL
ncbi:transport 172 homolog [Argonauta hians]